MKKTEWLELLAFRCGVVKLGKTRAGLVRIPEGPKWKPLQRDMEVSEPS